MPQLPFWKADGNFQRAYGQARPRTLVDEIRCFIIYQFARRACDRQGDFAEVGVYKGGTARLLGGFGKTLHLFDTFQGMPESKPDVDRHKAGDFGDTSLASVQEYLRELGPGIHYHNGLFPQSSAGLECIRFAFVHIDVDIYDSTKSCAEFFYPRLTPGAAMIFDDYGFDTCPGCKKAVDEFSGRT